MAAQGDEARFCSSPNGTFPVTMHSNREEAQTRSPGNDRQDKETAFGLLFEGFPMRTSAAILGLVFILTLIAFTEAAPPPVTPADNPPQVDAGVLPAGQFTGTLVSPPDGDRMFTVTITYPEVRQKAGARMPNVQNAQAQ